jgi:hypothetical protein
MHCDLQESMSLLTLRESFDCIGADKVHFSVKDRQLILQDDPSFALSLLAVPFRRNRR